MRFLVEAQEDGHPDEHWRLTEHLYLSLSLLYSVRAHRYKRLVTNFFALFVGKFGPHVFFQRLNSLQEGVGLQLLQQVWNPHLKTDPPISHLEAKTQVVGLTKMLTESPALLSDDNQRLLWSQTLATVVTLLTSPTLKKVVAAEGVDADEFEIGYDAQYSKLQFASRPADDFFPDVPADPTLFFVQSLHQLLSQHPGQLIPIIQHGLNGADSKLLPALTAMFQQAGLALT